MQLIHQQLLFIAYFRSLPHGEPVTEGNGPTEENGEEENVLAEENNEENDAQLQNNGNYHDDYFQDNNNVLIHKCFCF